MKYLCLCTLFVKWETVQYTGRFSNVLRISLLSLASFHVHTNKAVTRITMSPVYGSSPQVFERFNGFHGCE